MKQKVDKKPEKKIAKKDCNHYWVIEVANGPTSSGVCKYCGEIKVFLNAFPPANPLKRQNNPLDLPKLPDVKMDEDSKS